MQKLKKQEKGITLLSLVITIIVLLILAGVTFNLLKDGGVIKQAQDATKISRLANKREQLSMEILSAQMEATVKGSELNKDQLGEIVNKYGELQEDGDTIKTEFGDISLKDVLEGNNELPEDQKKKIAELEATIKQLEETIASLNSQLDTEKDNKERLEGEIASLEREIETSQTQIGELNTQLAEKNQELEDKNQTISQLEESVNSLNGTVENLNTQVANLTKTQATGNAGVADVLTGKTFSNASGVGLTGTMPSYTSGSTAVTATGKWGFDTTYGPWLYAPNNAYYGTGHWFNIPWATIKDSLGTAAAGNVLTGSTFTSTNGVKVAGTMPNRGNLNWSGSNTTYAVPAGYYSGGTLDSRPSYNAGVTAGKNSVGTTTVQVNATSSSSKKNWGTLSAYYITITIPAGVRYAVGSYSFISGDTGKGMTLVDCDGVISLQAGSGATVSNSWGWWSEYASLAVGGKKAGDKVEIPVAWPSANYATHLRYLPQY